MDKERIRLAEAMLKDTVNYPFAGDVIDHFSRSGGRPSTYISRRIVFGNSGMDALRGGESRATWINRAITELTIRQLLQKRMPFSDKEFAKAVRLGQERGIIIPE
ncbi:MAG: hypothetical protein ACLP4V_24725 [Methylocella sp.]